MTVWDRKAKVLWHLPESPFQPQSANYSWVQFTPPSMSSISKASQGKATSNGISPHWGFFFPLRYKSIWKEDKASAAWLRFLFRQSSGSEIIAVCCNWWDAGRDKIQVESGAILGDLLRLARFYQFQWLRCLWPVAQLIVKMAFIYCTSIKRWNPCIGLTGQKITVYVSAYLPSAASAHFRPGLLPAAIKKRVLLSTLWSS